MEQTNVDNDYKLSSFNSAGKLIDRLNELWTSAHRDVRNGNYFDWNILLDRLWLEISGDLKENAPEHNIMLLHNAKIVALMPLPSGNNIGFNKRDKIDYEKLSKQYLALREKEAFIKRMEGKLGLGKAYVDELEDDFE